MGRGGVKGGGGGAGEERGEGREERGARGRGEQHKTSNSKIVTRVSGSELSLIAFSPCHPRESHLGRYTSTFCFFTEFAHSSISCTLTNGSRVASGTSCLDNTSIILISSPSYGISRTWQIPPASLEPSLNSPEKKRNRIKGPNQTLNKRFKFVITFVQNSVEKKCRHLRKRRFI